MILPVRHRSVSPYLSVRSFQEFPGPGREINGKKGYKDGNEYLATGVGTANIKARHVRQRLGSKV